MSEDVRVILVDAAKAAHDQMLDEVRADGRIKINSSKLVNWIVRDYFERIFRQRKGQLCKEHFNERKCLQEALKIKDPVEKRRALQELARSFASQVKVRKKGSAAIVTRSDNVESSRE